MEVGSGGTTVLEELGSSMAALRGLALKDAASGIRFRGAGVGAGVDVLQRRYEIRLERLELVSRLEAQLAAVKA